MLTIFQPKEYGYSCAGITPEGVQAASDANPLIGAKIEAVLILARSVCDEGGHRMVGPKIPPSLALAIIRALESECPPDTAFRMATGQL